MPALTDTGESRMRSTELRAAKRRAMRNQRRAEAADKQARAIEQRSC